MDTQTVSRPGLLRWLPGSVGAWCWLLPAVIGVPLVSHLPRLLAGPEPADPCDWRAAENQRFQERLDSWVLMGVAAVLVLFAISVAGPLLTRATPRPATGPRPSGRAVALLVAGLVALQLILAWDQYAIFFWFTPVALLVLGYKSRALRWIGYGVLLLLAALNLLAQWIGALCIA